MEKKNSGMGLEEISNIFLSTKENATENLHHAKINAKFKKQ